MPPAPNPKSNELIAVVQGRYEMANNQMQSFIVLDGHLFTMSGGRPDEAFVFTDKTHIASLERNLRFGVERDAAGVVVGLTIPQGAMTHLAPRLGPLFRDVSAQSSTDAPLDMRIETTLRAMGAGGAAWASATGVTEGVRRDFGARGWQPARALMSLTYVGTSNVSGRSIERHDANVAQIRYYRMVTSRGTAMLLVHLTADGLIADIDAVDE
ncbi:MAG: hypothetical protein M3Z05_17345 [Gemmatimonadota bacterium]|nr:hypothetical protein [Gemmatimonadota bacterium]